MKISIAMATYNGEKYLQEQLDSFVHQIRQPDELVVTDDCSTDRTLELLTAFKQTAPFQVRIIRNHQNTGYVKAFEKSLLNCSGKYIFLSDQDDIWYRNKIARVFHKLKESNLYLVCLNDADLVDSQLNPLGATRLDRRRQLKLPDVRYNSGCCAALRREYVNFLLPFPSGCDAHDTWLLQLATRIGHSALIEEPLQLMRRHDKNTSSGGDKDARLPFYLAFVKRLLVTIIPPAVDLSSKVTFLEFCINKHIPCLLSNYREKIPTIEDALNHFQRIVELELDSLKTRKKILSLKPWARLLPVCKAYQLGLYDQWGGFITALRDLIRPRVIPAEKSSC